MNTPHPHFLSRHNLFVVCACLLIGLLAPAAWFTSAPVAAQDEVVSPDGIWRRIDAEEQRGRVKFIAPDKRFHAAQLNVQALMNALRKVPLEQSADLSESRSIITVPLPDGTFARFRLEESSVMEPALAARFPEIKTYRGQGVDDQTATLRCDLSPRGFHAFVLVNGKEVSVQPLSLPNGYDDVMTYASYDGSAVAPDDFECLAEQLPRERLRNTNSPRIATGPTRYTFRIAIATTYEYSVAPSLGGGTAASALASVVTWLNSVNAIYERDLSIHFNLVANNNQIIYATSADPFTNGAASTMLSEVRTVLRDRIGEANYDLGQVLGTGSSGVAYLGVVCDDYDFGGYGPVKGAGVSLISTSVSVGHIFYITRIAHEIGHQFGANHSFNDTHASCVNQRAASSAVESGSGLTVMSYAGSCNAITLDRAAHFHGNSIAEINDYLVNYANCAVTSSTGNSAPTVGAGADRTIPKQTPFTLTATAADANASDAPNLSYAWEQNDIGGASYGNPPFTDSGESSATTRPIFRPYAPTTSAARTFPSLTYILNNANVPPSTYTSSGYTFNTGESLPQVARLLNFRVTVRDQRGGVNQDDVLLTVDGAGPFAVTAPNTTVSWAGGASQTITWSVNGTNGAPINCANVKLSLSTDGGNTFPVTLLSSTPNDGSETITVPSGYAISTARVKVEAVGNIFFDISNTNFTLTAGTASCPTVSGISPTSGAVGASVTITGTNFTGVTAVKFTSNINATFAINSNTQMVATVPTGATSGPLTISKTNCSDLQTASFSVTANCSYTLGATFANAAAGASTGTVNLTAPTGCAWTATSNVAWLTTSASGSGNGSVGYAVQANTGAQRSGTLTIAGQTFTVTQAAGCTFTINPASASIAANGGTGTTNVTAGAGCAWTATESATWLTITAGAAGSGNGSVNFTAAANTGIARSAAISVGGQTFTVNQASGCAPTINPTAASIVAGGGTGSFNVTAGTGCTWAAAESTTWLTITAGASGSGNGTVNFTADANTGAARTATITVGAQTFTISQAALNCTYTISPTSASVAAAGGSGSFNVTAPAGCTWTASESTSWLTINAGASGNGNGTVNYSITANTDAARSATITIGGQTFTINQTAGCSFTINPTSASVAAGGGTGSVNVTAGTGCTWTVASNAASWLMITAGASGSGNGTVNYAVAANPGAARSGTLTVAGQTVTVAQAAVATTNPAPTLNGLTPNAALVGGAAFTLTVTGANFAGGATVRWNGVNCTTTFVSKTELRAAVTSADIAQRGTANVTVFNPAPGGGTSSAAVFMIQAIVTSVSAASFLDNGGAPESIATAFGAGLATRLQAATSTTLPTTLAGTTVTIKDSAGTERAAQLFFVAPNQINYVVPAGSAPGKADVLIKNALGEEAVGTLQLNGVAPGLFTANASGRGVPAGVALRVRADGSQRYETILRFDPMSGAFVAVPIELGAANDKVYLVLYGTGIRHRSSLANVAATIGGTAVTVEYAGAQGTFTGLDQLNLLLPRTLLGRGEVGVALTVDGRQANVVTMSIK